MPKAARSSRPKTHAVTVTTEGPEEPNERRRQNFGRDARLPDEAAFSRVFKRSQRSRDRFFTVLCSINGNRRSRLGLAIAKKHCRRAVDRNRLKRIVRESFRRHRQELAGLDLVVLNRPDAHDVDNKQLFESLAAHWQRCRSNKRRKQS